MLLYQICFITTLISKMRTAYVAPNTLEFDVLFESNETVGRGGGISDISTYARPEFLYQRGGSFLGVLGRIVQRTIPFLKSIIVPEVGNFARNVSADYGHGVPLRQSLKKNSVVSAKNIGSALARKARGGRYKRQKPLKNKRKNVKKKKRNNSSCLNANNDIFSRSKLDL